MIFHIRCVKALKFSPENIIFESAISGTFFNFFLNTIVLKAKKVQIRYSKGNKNVIR
jgi:hypothetical protein